MSILSTLIVSIVEYINPVCPCLCRVDVITHNAQNFLNDVFFCLFIRMLYLILDLNRVMLIVLFPFLEMSSAELFCVICNCDVSANTWCCGGGGQE